MTHLAEFRTFVRLTYGGTIFFKSNGKQNINEEIRLTFTTNVVTYGKQLKAAKYRFFEFLNYEFIMKLFILRLPVANFLIK